MGAGSSTPEVPVPANIAAPTPEQLNDPLSSGLADSGDSEAAKTFLNASVLERLADAAAKLKGDENTDKLIDLMHAQEKSWQENFKVQQQEAAMLTEREKQQLEVVRQQEQRKTMEAQQEQQAQAAQYKDRMDRKRYDDQLQQQHQAQERQRQLELQTAQGVEAEKRRSMEHQAVLDRETNKMQALAQGLASAQQERENKDIRGEHLLIQEEQRRITALEGIREAGAVIGKGVTDYLSDTQKIGATVGVVTALAIGIYSVRAGTAVASKYISSRLSQPPLIRDTSRKSPVLSPIGWIKSKFGKQEGEVLSGIVLEKELQLRLRDITVSTTRTRQHGANYRNMMLYGPPGTGKTMFAMRLAKQSGLDYAVLAGGDVAPLGSAAITEIHRVFDWGESRKNGLVLFVDEADAFLRRRGNDQDGEMSEDMRNALSTFLYRTGTQSNKVMLVLATNEPGSFDRAVVDRVDERVEFKLPGLPERAALLQKYFSEAVLNPSRRIRIADELKAMIGEDQSSVECWDSIATDLEGFSGRGIMKLCNAWQAAAYASVDNTLTPEMLDRELKSHQQQQVDKESWDDVAETR